MLLCPTSPLELSVNACGHYQRCTFRNACKRPQYGNVRRFFPIPRRTLVTHNAEVLAGITLAQLTVPGAKVWYGSSTTTFDLKKGTAPVGSPELGLISASVAKLAQFYGLPAFVAGT